jgi:hypothetical protein
MEDRGHPQRKSGAAFQIDLLSLIQKDFSLGGRSQKGNGNGLLSRVELPIRHDRLIYLYVPASFPNTEEDSFCEPHPGL